MKNIAFCLSIINLFVACGREKVDWRQQYEGDFVGSGKLKSYAMMREDIWNYKVNVKVLMDPEISNRLMIVRSSVDRITPESGDILYFKSRMSYFGAADSTGELSVPSQKVSMSNEVEPLVIAEKTLTNPRRFSYGKFGGDSLVLVISYSNKDMRDSMVVHRR